MAKPETSLGFIVGCGRSGTNWLGELLGTADNVTVSLEGRDTFPLVTRLALEPRDRHRHINELVSRYRNRLRRSRTAWFVDKAHPAMWIAEYLLDAFPGARFIGIQRDPYQTVASMIAHGGVSSWASRWREYSVPNQFLGISLEICAEYDTMSLAKKHALRWRSHQERLSDLSHRYPDSFELLDYGQLVTQELTAATLQRVSDFLGLPLPIADASPRPDTTSKWRAALSESDIVEISEVTGVAVPLPPTQF